MKPLLWVVALAVAFAAAPPAAAAVIDVSSPIQLTQNNHYERGQSITTDGARYWLFYGRSVAETGSYETGNPDVHDYQIFCKKAGSVPALAGASPAPIPGAANSFLGETGAVYFGGQIWAFATLDRDGAYTPAADCDLYGWYTTSGLTWTQVGPIIADLGDGQAHHDEVAFNGELWVLEGQGDFTTIRSATPESGGWTAPDTVGSLSGGIGRFFVSPRTYYPVPGSEPALCLILFSEHRSYVYQWDSAGEAWVGLAAVDNPRAYDPALFMAGDSFVLAEAPLPEDWSTQWISWRSDTTLVGVAGSPAHRVTEARYGSNTWFDMWPIGFVDAGGSPYLFYTSERDQLTQEGDGDVWCVKIDWPIENEHATFIQTALETAAAGDTVCVGAGVYAENLTLSVPLTLTGAGRDQVTVYPAVSDIGGTGGPSFGCSQLAVVQATDVTIQGISFDGDSPFLTPPGQLDARNGIITNYNLGDWSNLEVRDCAVRNVYLRGIYASAQSSLSNVDFIDNIVTNVRGVSYQSAGIMFYRTRGHIEGNAISNCSIGVMHHTLSSGYIEDNEISDCDNCVAVNSNAEPTFVLSNAVLDYVDSGIQTVEPHAYVLIYDNDIVSEVPPGAYDQFGIYVFGQYSGYTGFQDIWSNRLGAQAIVPKAGRAPYGSPGRPPLALDECSVQPSRDRDPLRWGIGVDTYGWASSMDVHARIRGNEIRNMDYGVLLCDAAGDPAPWMDVIVGGAAAHTNIFVASTYEELTLAAVDDNVNAQYNDWGSDDPAYIEENIWDQVDDPALGLVDFSNYVSAQGVAPADGGEVLAWMSAPAPNPFGETTTLRLALGEGEAAEIGIYGVDGRRVAHHSWDAGAGRQVLFIWDGKATDGADLPAGVYFLRGRIGTAKVEERLVRLR